MKETSVIIDTDPGSDDIFAIFLANSNPRLKIEGLTIVAGNVKAELTFENGLAIRDFLKIDAEVAFGAKRPLCINQRLGSFLHGDRGLGKFQIPTPHGKASQDYAWDFLYKKVKQRPGEIAVIALGPLTNLAFAILKYPQITHFIKEIILMGGSTTYGNRSAYSEFNIWADPHSADIVFKSGIPIKMLGLNVTNQSAIPYDQMNRLYTFESRESKAIQEVFWYYEEYFRGMNLPGIVIHDAVAVAAAIDPQMITWEKCSIKVETEGELESGRTVAYHGKSNHVEAGIKIDQNSFMELCENMMKFYALQ